MATTGVFKFENGECLVAGKSISVNERQRLIFITLCESDHQIIDKVGLYKKVFPEHGDAPISAANLDALAAVVSKLRNKINQAFPHKQYGLLIEDFPKVGMKVAKRYGQGKVCFLNLTLDLETGLVQKKTVIDNRVAYEPIKLGVIKKRLLILLASQKDHVITHQDIFDFLYQDYKQLGLPTNQDGWLARLTGMVADLRSDLDTAEMGASTYIETHLGAYRFTLTPNLHHAVRQPAVAIHEERFDEDDPTAIHLGDLVLSARSHAVMSVYPPEGDLNRMVILSKGARRLLLVLCQSENYGRYLHVSDMYRAVTGKEGRGYNSALLMGYAKELADKINPTLCQPFIHVSEIAFRVAVGVEKPRLTPEIIKAHVRAGNLHAFNGYTKLMRYQKLDFDASSDTIRNTENGKTFTLEGTAGKVLRQLLINPTKPLSTNELAASIGSTFESLRNGGIIKQLDEALSSVGLKGILYTTPSTSHIQLDFSPAPVLAPARRQIKINPKNITSLGAAVNFKPWQRDIVSIMNEAGGQICLEQVPTDKDTIVKTKNGQFRLSEASPEAFASIMNGLGQKLIAKAESDVAVFRNFHGCYRFGPDISFHL